ncbi:prepilin-type N-terminal cleavage/methylation domain-containing protein [candidate division WWE3 bacterium]|nr:prepilin-type N-terminal cleavage/methylation domain-containing protein [candidate division WWE3 bacterium]
MEVKVKKQLGFTLVELLVVVSVVLISVGVAGDLIISIIRSYNKTRVLNEIEQNGNYALAKVVFDLRNAKAITGLGDCPSLSTGFTLTDQSSKSIVYSIDQVNGTGGLSCTSTCTWALRRNYDSVGAEAITNYDLTEGVSLDMPESGFCLASNSPNPLAVDIRLVFKQGPSAISGKSSEANVPFNSIVALKGINQ